MRKISILAPFIFLLLFFTSCDSGKEVDTFFEGMMEIHHKDMVVWGEIPGLKKSIKQELEAFEARRAEGPVDTARIQTLEKGLKELETANDAMNDWMHQFKPDKKAPKEEAMAYLVEQKKAMEEMGKEVSEAVIGAKELLKKAN